MIDTDTAAPEVTAEHGKPETPGEGHTPVDLCHNGHTITVDDDAVPGHLGHHADDYLGVCIVVEETPTDDTTPEVPEPTPTPVEEVPLNPIEPVAETPSEGMTPCTEEDGSLPGQTFPCVWDAEQTGNGEGCSFVLDEVGGVPHYVTEILGDGTIYTDDTACVPAWTVRMEQQAMESVASTETALNPVEPALAETGMNAGAGVGIALALLIVGVLAKRLAKRGAM